MTGQDQPDVYATRRCTQQGLDQLWIGYKVGIGDGYRFLCIGNRGDQGQIDQAERVIRRAAHGTHDFPTLRCQRGEIVLSGERRSLLLLPALDEQLLEFSNDRPFNLNVGIAPSRCGIVRFLADLDRRSAGIDAADIDAAVYDLKAVNPNVKAVSDTRTVLEIIDNINLQGQIAKQTRWHNHLAYFVLIN